MTAEQRHRTAIHEASHAYLSVLFNVPLDVVSIRGTERYLGICGLRHTAAVQELDLSRPLVTQKAGPRRALEAHMRISLAGPAADRLWFRETGFVATPTFAPRLPAPAAARLRVLEEDGNRPADEEGPRFVPDEQTAADLAMALVGSALAPAYYAWAAAETQQLVADGQDSIQRISGQLLARDAIGSHDLRAFIPRRKKDMPWHPILAGADPSSAWFSPEELAKQRRAYEDALAFRRMLERRRRLEAAAQPTNPNRAKEDPDAIPD